MIIVTGGAGFIGSGVVKTLNEENRGPVVIIDDLDDTTKWQNLLGKTFQEIIPIDETFSYLENHKQEVKAIIHLGACSSTVEKDGNFLLKNNTRFSIRLAQFALAHGIRMIYASSAATYGDGSKGFSDAHDALETLEPLNLYGFSKHLFDLWALREGALNQLVGLKYFNVFGPNEGHKGRMASAIWHFYPQAKEKKTVRLFQSNDPKYPNGGQCRDFIYVKEACKMTTAFLDNDVGGIFNIGRGEGGTWNQMANALFSSLGIQGNIEYIKMPDDLQGKYQNYTAADMAKTKKALGLEKPEWSLEEAVKDYVVNYLEKEKSW